MDHLTDFDNKILDVEGNHLSAHSLKTLQVNVGLRCNNQCVHCHLQAAPERTEMMNWSTMQWILKAASRAKPELIDLTGGAPELNHLLIPFLLALREKNHAVQVRTNLTVLLEPGMKGVLDVFRDANVKLLASLPSYEQKAVDSQRGLGAFEKSIEVLKYLNEIGYGITPQLKLDLVCNPIGPALPPEQSLLEEKYRVELDRRFGIVFNRLRTITNMPVGRFLQELHRVQMKNSYERLLRESFNHNTIDKLMCRHQISVGWDGTLYDCDFNLGLLHAINYPLPPHIQYFDRELIVKRQIVTGTHCFGCAAGSGSSCEGALDLENS